DVPAPEYGYVALQPGADTLDVRVSYNPMSYYLAKKVAWTAFRRRPWTGIGIGTFPLEAERAFLEGRLHPPHQRIIAHSTPFGRLAETGLIGFAGLIALAAMVWRSGLSASRTNTLAWALLAGALG